MSTSPTKEIESKQIGRIGDRLVSLRFRLVVLRDFVNSVLSPGLSDGISTCHLILFCTMYYTADSLAYTAKQKPYILHTLFSSSSFNYKVVTLLISLVGVIIRCRKYISDNVQCVRHLYSSTSFFTS